MSDQARLFQQLPDNWESLLFSNAVENISTIGKKIKQKDYLPTGKFPVIDQGADYIGGFTDDEGKVLDCKLPVIIFGDHTKIVKFVNRPFAPGADGVKVLQPKEFFEPKLFFYFTQVLANQIISKGYARHYQYLSKSFIPLPPLNEQRRIVAKIEELFSELDAGVAALEQARAQLKRYRQALLKAAFEGRLTEGWRQAHAGELEPAEALLARIRAEREARWRAQLAEWEADVRAWEAAGKPGRKPRKPRKPKELPPLTEEELAELPELPEGWAWEYLGAIAQISGGITKNQNRKELPLQVPYLRVANVYANRLELEDIDTIGVTKNEFERALLQPGDLLIVEGNGSIEQIGRVAMWNGEIDVCLHQNHLIKARLSSEITPKFVLHFLLSELGRKMITTVASSTSGLHTLSLSKVSKLIIPICSADEQKEVVQILDTYLSTIDYLDQTIEEALTRAAGLRQAILKKAFSGRLVPQDPGDEPAGVLLERIRAEKQKLPSHHPKTPRKSRP